MSLVIGSDLFNETDSSLLFANEEGSSQDQDDPLRNLVSMLINLFPSLLLLLRSAISNGPMGENLINVWAKCSV